MHVNTTISTIMSTTINTIFNTAVNLKSKIVQKALLFSFLGLLVPIAQAEVVSEVSIEVLNANNPPQYQQFRLDYADMVELASADRLSHRVFYEQPSQGADAKWFDAIKQGNIALVKQMVADGQNIEAKDEASLGQTALGWAAFIGDEEIVDYLLAQGADLWATDRGDVSNTLKSAGLGNNLAVFKKLHYLLQDQIDIDDQKADWQGETILIVAASNDRRQIVEYLLTIGANPNLVTTEQDKNHPAYDQDALTFACANNLPEMQNLLIKHGAINHRTNQPACDNGAQ